LLTVTPPGEGRPPRFVLEHGGCDSFIAEFFSGNFDVIPTSPPGCFASERAVIPRARAHKPYYVKPCRAVSAQDRNVTPRAK
jgi:hypothetical protein